MLLTIRSFRFFRGNGVYPRFLWTSLSASVIFPLQSVKYRMCCTNGQKSIGHDRAGTRHFFRLSDPPAIRVPFSGVSHSRKGTVTRILPEQPVMNGSVTVCILPYPRFFPPFRLSACFSCPYSLASMQKMSVRCRNGRFGEMTVSGGGRLRSGLVIDCGIADGLCSGWRCLLPLFSRMAAVSG